MQRLIRSSSRRRRPRRSSTMLALLLFFGLPMTLTFVAGFLIGYGLRR